MSSAPQNMFLCNLISFVTNSDEVLRIKELSPSHTHFLTSLLLFYQAEPERLLLEGVPNDPSILALGEGIRNSRIVSSLAVSAANCRSALCPRAQDEPLVLQMIAAALENSGSLESLRISWMKLDVPPDREAAVWVHIDKREVFHLRGKGGFVYPTCVGTIKSPHAEVYLLRGQLHWRTGGEIDCPVPRRLAQP